MKTRTSRNFSLPRQHSRSSVSSSQSLPDSTVSATKESNATHNELNTPLVTHAVPESQEPPFCDEVHSPVAQKVAPRPAQVSRPPLV
eukprot:17818_5